MGTPLAVLLLAAYVAQSNACYTVACSHMSDSPIPWCGATALPATNALTEGEKKPDRKKGFEGVAAEHGLHVHNLPAPHGLMVLPQPGDSFNASSYSYYLCRPTTSRMRASYIKYRGLPTACLCDHHVVQLPPDQAVDAAPTVLGVDRSTSLWRQVRSL